jgi:hypothetical protein
LEFASVWKTLIASPVAQTVFRPSLVVLVSTGEAMISKGTPSTDGSTGLSSSCVQFVRVKAAAAINPKERKFFFIFLKS